jgi:hypothetical protein
LIGRPSSRFTTDNNRPVSMLANHAARQRFSTSPSAIGMPLKTAL